MKPQAPPGQLQGVAVQNLGDPARLSGLGGPARERPARQRQTEASKDRENYRLEGHGPSLTPLRPLVK